ncbi:transglycosylase family protein [Streptomyces niveiscabiei]|uniref:LysM peptidoglycan-binding domain-containing protein n=1 Tax=Streptomyces niveiscabiei TaxID=164115 RepID=UPI0029B9F40C|nr:transglycosylase family protein [Streptomyces niveiscabiei]MDX3387900.1 transglycosylase family protein [Streptomyces niveiscabiei]
MLSGNGRHRRPRQAPALLVAAGVTGTAIAIPLLGASGASAAGNPAGVEGTTVWDKVADCETDAAWDENTGSGQFGGLHIKLDDWKKYGGLAYAERPDLAGRAEQIEVGKRILADRGPGFWPICALTAGLTKENGAAATDATPSPSPSPGTGTGTGSTDTSGSSGTSGASGTSNGSGSTAGSGASGSTDPGASPSPTPTPSTPGKSPEATPQTPQTSPTPQTPDSSAETGNSAEAGKDSGSGRIVTPEAPQGSDSKRTEPSYGDKSGNAVQPPESWSLVDTSVGAAVGASPILITPPSTASTLSTAGTGKHRGLSADEPESYTVRVGDTLSSIADSLELDGGWRALYAANKDLIGADPSAIVPGQPLSLGD